MPGFLAEFFKVEDTIGKEAAVCCPFPHSTGAHTYMEQHPSAHVNLKERVFHCKVCGVGLQEQTFIKNLLQCTVPNAVRISKAFNNYETIQQYEEYTKLTEGGKALALSLGISEAVITELQITNLDEEAIMFPVLMHDHLIDLRTYRPGATPKVTSRIGAPAGMVIPLDIWQKENPDRVTVLCAGEKDMAVTRSQGFNAITLTGGEGTIPLADAWFRGRNVVICYDNDDAGLAGAKKIATHLLPICKTVKVCTGFHNVCKEKGEDLTDFFNKYSMKGADLIAYMNSTPFFTAEDAIKTAKNPLVTLQQATSSDHINRLVRSNIQVVAVSEAQYVVPTVMLAEKLKETEAGDTMYAGEMREWELTENNIQDILHLTDNNFKEEDINANAKKLLHVPPKEKYVRLNKNNKEVVYKVYVTDMFESMNTDSMPMEYTAYSVGTRLESGKKYMVTHKLVPHPYKGQQLIMLIMNAVEANDSVTNFALTEETVSHLQVVQSIGGTIEEKMLALTEKVKGILNYNGNNTLIQVLDLAYHTVLSFNLGAFTNVRGYLDTLVVGESRVGKSSTAEALRNTYQLGTFTSLAGNSATIPGLVGGSNKTSGGAFQTKAGLIPQNHKGLIIFEEFGKCRADIVSELTDIRSSNEVRITRISGTLSLPATVRMISLSNVKAFQGEIKSIASYPNGISIITELVTTAEDIARYDLIAVLGDKGANQIDPYWTPAPPLPEEVYRTRVRWVWSRSAEQVVISDEVGRHIIDKSNELNKDYDSHIKFFGTEAWKKLSRLSIAVAGYLVSTDPTYNNIIVTKEHVDYAASLYIKLYDNPTFRLREYVENERKYSIIDAKGVSLLNELYQKAPALLLMLEQEARPSRNTLMAAVGLDANTYNGFLSMLVRGSFVKLASNDILPTERFRLGMAQINREVLMRVGENNAQVEPQVNRDT